MSLCPKIRFSFAKTRYFRCNTVFVDTAVSPMSIDASVAFPLIIITLFVISKFIHDNQWKSHRGSNERRWNVNIDENALNYPSIMYDHQLFREKYMFISENTDSSKITRFIEWKACFWTRWVVRDLWKRKDIGTFTGSFTSPAIDPHSVMMFKISLVNTF